jgi:hypothetical protein
MNQQNLYFNSDPGQRRRKFSLLNATMKILVTVFYTLVIRIPLSIVKFFFYIVFNIFRSFLEVIITTILIVSLLYWIFSEQGTAISFANQAIQFILGMIR